MIIYWRWPIAFVIPFWETSLLFEDGLVNKMSARSCRSTRHLMHTKLKRAALVSLGQTARPLSVFSCIHQFNNQNLAVAADSCDGHGERNYLSSSSSLVHSLDACRTRGWIQEKPVPWHRDERSPGRQFTPQQPSCACRYLYTAYDWRWSWYIMIYMYKMFINVMDACSVLIVNLPGSLNSIFVAKVHISCW